MWRPILLPGLGSRTALGQTGANQWFGQVERGCRFELGTPAATWVTPFARLQAYTGTQNGFTETGAPAMPFTTFGISPTRDGALLGFGANTVIADATSVYLRYKGIIASQDSTHALTAGLRMTW